MQKKPLARASSIGPALAHGSLSVADFDQSEWEIMYPRFVESRLVVPPKRTDNLIMVGLHTGACDRLPRFMRVVIFH
jgi:hypothetical protein